MRNPLKALGLWIVCAAAIVLSNCSNKAPETGPNYAFGMFLYPAFGFVGTPIAAGPTFAVFQLVLPPSLYSDFNDSISLGVYTDSKCTLPATGTLSVGVTPNPQPITAGIADFSTASFTYSTPASAATPSPLPSWAEGVAYFKGTLVTNNLSYCSKAVPLINHFNPPLGYVTASTGASGVTAQQTINDAATAIQLDSIGRYVVAGYSVNSSSGKELAIWRYLPTGAIDTSFPQDGSKLGYIHSGTTGAAGAVGAATQDEVTSLKIDSAGNYLLAGRSKNGSGTTVGAIWRYTSAGQLDTTFNSGISTGGIQTFATTSGVSGRVSVAIDSNNSNAIVASTSTVDATNGTNLYLTRYSTDGTIDKTFAVPVTGVTGVTGIYSSTTSAAGATGSNVTDLPNDLKIDSDGNYVIAGTSKDSTGNTRMAIWRFKSKGTLDTSWGSNSSGIYVSSSPSLAGGSIDQPNALLIDSKKRYVVVGYTSNASGGKQLAVWRFTSTGLDTSFNNSGMYTFGSTGAAGATAANTFDQGTGVVEDTNHNLIISGSSKNTTGGTQMAMWFLTENGQLNTNLSYDSSARLPTGVSSSSPQNGYVVFSQSTSSSVGLAGATTTQLYDASNAMAIDTVGSYIMVGQTNNSTASNSGGTQLAIWRYLWSGIIDQ